MLKSLNRKRRKGFTLSELLIALAILGVIATFAIPKVLQAANDSRKKSILKDNVSHTSALINEAILTKAASTDTEMIAYFYSHWNALKICDTTDTISGGCRTQGLAWESWNIASHDPGVAMVDGSTVFVRANGTCTDLVTIVIDYNGDGPPNALGLDALMIYYRIASTGVCPATPPKVIGRFQHWGSPGHAQQSGRDNDALYNSLW